MVIGSASVVYEAVPEESSVPAFFDERQSGIGSVYIRFRKWVWAWRGTDHTIQERCKELGKDRTTIAREIRKYSYDKKSGRPGYPYNPRKNRNSCKAKKVCGANGCTHQSAYKCSLCSECTFHCPDFEEDICSGKRKPPYVCSGCRVLPDAPF